MGCKSSKSKFCTDLRTVDPYGFPAAPSVEPTARVPIRYWKDGEPAGNYYIPLDSIALDVNNTAIGYVPAASGNTTNLNQVVVASDGSKWVIDINGDAMQLESSAPGTVTEVSSDNATPLFNVNVATPTTTPHFSYTFPNISQYQVWGRVAAGTGLPSYVTLNPIAFTGIAVPYREVVFGTGTGVSSSNGFKEYGNGRIALGNTNSITGGVYGIVVSGASNVINVTGGSVYATYLNGYNNSYFGSVSGSNGIIVNGSTNTVDISSYTASNIFISGYNNKIQGLANNVSNTALIGAYFTANHYGVVMLGDANNYPIATTTFNQFIGRFNSGYSFMKTNSTRFMNIASNGYVTIDTIPTASTDNLLISNGGVVSTRLVSTLPFTNNNGTVTSVAASITSSTALAISGSPITTSGTLAFSWTGTAAQYIKGDGTLGTLPADMDAQTLTWTKNTSNLAISGGNNVNLFTLTSLASGDLIKWDGTDWVNFVPTWTTNTGTVTSVAATVTASTALTVSGSPITTAGTLAFSWTGAVTDYVRGDGTLKPFPTVPSTLDDLTDVVITTPASGDLLRWDGTNWVDWTPNYLTSLAHVHYVANSSGTNQFSFGVNEAVRFAAGTDIGITFDSATKKVTVAYTGSGGSNLPVWKVQGGTTDATTNTQNIYHNAKVAVGDYSGSVSSYQLAVSGQTYSTLGTIINNNQFYKAFNTGGVSVNVAGFNSSNQTVLGNTGYDIILPAYPNTRTDSFYTVPAIKILYTDSNGKLLLTDKKAFYNDHASAATETQAGVTAGGGWYRLPNDSAYNTNSYYTQFDHNSTNNDVQIPRGDQIFHVLVSVEWEMQSGGSGTPYVQFQIRLNNSTTGVKTPNWYFYATGYKFTTTFQSIVSATGSGMYDIAVYCNVASGTGSIYINRSVKMVTNVGYQLT